MSITLRPASLDDGLALVAIEQQSFPNPHWDAESFFLYDCTVAVDGTRITGFCVSRQTAPKTALESCEREILNLAVHPDHRRHGIATTLLLNEITRPGTHFLEVRESNLRALELYAKLGFQEVATRSDYYQNPAESAIVMTLKRW